MLKSIIFVLGLLPTMLFAGQQQSINRIITFGDSLSDAGNKHLISLYMHQATKGIIGIRAMPPNVSARYSNGFTWVDQLNISLWRQPSTPALNKIVTPLIIDIDDQAIMYPLSIRALKGTNWAIGGAMAGEGYFVDLDLSKGAELTQGGRIMPNIGQQIKDFEQSQTHFQPSDLIILQGGTNNLWFTLFGDVAETGSQTALKLIRHIKQLRALGAQHILLMNLPPFQHGATLHPYADETQRFVDEFNQTLNDQLPQFTPQKNRPSNVYLLDVHRIFTDMIHSIQTKGSFTHAPTQVEINYILKPAWDWVNNKVADKANEHAFWDGLHPSASLHRLFAYEAEQLLSENDIHFATKHAK